MASAVTEAISLDPVVRIRGIGNVMQAVVKASAAMGCDVVGWRRTQQLIISESASALSALNTRLVVHVPPHGRHLVGHMQFALLYAMVAATGDVDQYVVDRMLRGFCAMYRVARGGAFRPIEEWPVERYTMRENVDCFDMVVRRLSVAARRAQRPGHESEWASLVSLWDGMVGADGEIAKGLMDGGPSGLGYTRSQIFTMFEGVPGGPRCLLRFAVWQNGKLRGCDDGLLCGHNERTQMEETIVCIGADFPSLVAMEFAKYTESPCRLGTDDVDSAYRRVLCAEPWYTVHGGAFGEGDSHAACSFFI